MEDLNNIETKIIKTQDENGETHNFELVDVVEVDGNEYGLLVYVEEGEVAKATGCDCDDEDCDCESEEEIIIMKLSKSGEAYSFETIENDDEFNKVVEFLESECDEEDDDEDGEEENDEEKA